MLYEDQIQRTIKTVHQAEEAVIEAQANNNQEEFQEAQQLLNLAHEMVTEINMEQVNIDQDLLHELQQAKVLLVHLLETQNSLQ